MMYIANRFALHPQNVYATTLNIKCFIANEYAWTFPLAAIMKDIFYNEIENNNYKTSIDNKWLQFYGNITVRVIIRVYKIEIPHHLRVYI